MDAQLVNARSQKLILVVDDEESIRTSLSRFLISGGYQVHTAESAEVAAALVRTEQVHAVVLDVRMPTLSGLNLLEWFQSEPDLVVDGIRVLLLTGHTLSESEKRFVETCGVPIFYKPASFQVILEALDAAVLER